MNEFIFLKKTKNRKKRNELKARKGKLRQRKERMLKFGGKAGLT